MDPLSTLLHELRLAGGFFLKADFFAPWCVNSAPAREDLRHLLPDAEQVILFHVVLSGHCRSSLPDGSCRLEAGPGEVIILPRGEAHVLGSDLQLAPVQAERLVEIEPHSQFMRIHHGGKGEHTRFVCGFLAVDPRLSRPLLDGLPGLFKVDLCDPLRADWVTQALSFAAETASTPVAGTGAVLSRLSELIFTEAMRRYLDQLPGQARGWLGAMRCPHVGRALAALHARPAHPWTLDELAAQALTSRTVLGERFRSLLGDPPLRYLARWRLALAARQLDSGDEALARVAERVGYDSEAAFNRAFKREFGVPPATWRRQRRPSPAP